MLDILFGDAAKLLGFQAGKARRIGQAATADLEDFHLTGSVAAAAQFLADLAGLALQLGCQSVQQRGLTHAGVAAESTQVVFDLRLDFGQTLAGLVVQLHQRDAAGFVRLHQGIRRAKVGLGHDQNRLHVLIDGRCRQLIQH